MPSESQSPTDKPLKLFNEHELTKIFETVDQHAARFLRDLPDRVEKILDNAIGIMIGVTQRYGRAEIDDRSELSRVIRARATKALHKLMDSFEGKLLAEAAKEFKKATSAKAFKDAYAQEFRRALITQAEEQAKADVAKLMDQVSAVKLRSLNDFQRNLEDPTAYCTAVGEVLLEDLAEKLVEPTESGPCLPQ